MSFLQYKKILAGLSLEGAEEGKLAEHERILLQVSLELAERLDATVRLVHIVEAFDHPWFEYVSSDVGLPSPSLDWLQEDVKKVFERRMAGLAKIKASLPVRRNIEFSVVTAANAASGLVAEALSSNCDMICLGCRGPIPQLFPSGLSTVLSLLADSPLPMLMSGQGMEADFSRPSLKLLLADDMRTESSFAIAHAAGFALQLKHGELHHAHVVSPNLASLPGGFAPDARKRLKTRMSDRVHYESGTWSSADVSYLAHDVTGNVADEIDQLVLKIGPDIILFGQHHGIHRRPFSLGKLALKGMIHYGRPIGVFPDSLILRRASHA